MKNSIRAYVLVCVNDEVLLTKNWLGMHKKWRLPGGGVQEGEDPVTAVVRELAEEVGIKAKKSEIVALTKKPLTSVFNYKYHLYTLRREMKPQVTADEREILEATFFSATSIQNVQLSEEAEAALELAKKP